MTTTTLLTAYAALAVAFWVHAIHAMIVRGRTRRRERLFGAAERMLFAIVALIASSAWPLLLPIRAMGGAQLAYERRGRASRRPPGRWWRSAAIFGRAA